MNNKNLKLSFTKETRQNATDKPSVAEKIKKQEKEREEEYRKNCENNKIENKK